MFSATLLAATMALGVDTGWRPAEEGGVEYIIQVDPRLIRTLGEGEMLQMDLPEKLREVRRFKIVVGQGNLPRLDPPQPMPDAGQSLPEAGQSLRQQTPPGQADRYGQLPDQAGPEAGSPQGTAGDSPQLPRFTLPAEQPAIDQSPSLPRQFDDNPASARESQQAAADKPRPFSSDSAKPITERASTFKQASAVQTKEPDVKAGQEDSQVSPSDAPAVPASDAEDEKALPWLPFLISVTLLCGSIGANIYLALMWLETRKRYHSLVWQRTPS